ncbi:MAG TPA: winged helix-turn-helix domain-containing protein [Caldimonas sp.]|jgi:predicted ATPase/DNA-binding winged helix-turn-helix (wHTH) protein
MEDALHFGAVEVRAAQRQVLVDGRPAAIGARAFDVLLVLLEHRDRVVTKDELIGKVWEGRIVEENNLHVQIGALRKFLGVGAIATIPGRGYRFVAQPEAGALPKVTEATEEAGRGLAAGLPQQRTLFFGRDREKRKALAALRDNPLLALIGIGGSGKTRLALELAREAEAQLPDVVPDGVAFLDLAAIGDPQDVDALVASGLGILEVPGTPIRQLLLQRLRASRRLLVLDNCEHLLEQVAGLVDALLSHCEGLRVLVTSREALGLEGERVQPVGALTLAAAEDLAALKDCDAARLFADRARLVNPEFDIDERNAAAVHEVCRRLDGIPLALELAAARLSVLSVDQLRDRLDDRFRLLTGGRRALPRQQTLDAVVRWSYEHLSVDEQRLLQRLAVFSGGSTVEAAVFVSGEDVSEPQVIDALSGLAAKSLIALDSDGHQPRHRMLETMRLFALEQLDLSGRAGEARGRHLAFFEKRARDLVEHPDPAVRSSAPSRLDADRDNLITALRHGANDGDPRTAWGLARSLTRYWETSGTAEVGYSLLESMLSARGAETHGETRVMALAALIDTAVRTGRFERTKQLADEQLRLARSLGDQGGAFRALERLVAARLALDDAAGAWSDVASMEALAADWPGGLRGARHMKAETLRAMGRLNDAEPLYRQNLDEGVSGGHAHHIILAAINLALLSLARPDLDAARKWVERIIEVRTQGDYGVYGVAFILLVAAALHTADRNEQEAVRLHGAAEAHLLRIGQRLEPLDMAPLAPFLTTARSAMPADAFEEAFDEGRALNQRSILLLAADCLPRRAG